MKEFFFIPFRRQGYMNIYQQNISVMMSPGFWQDTLIEHWKAIYFLILFLWLNFGQIGSILFYSLV